MFALEGRNNMAAYNETEKISIECVDNADGFPGVTVYDDTTFPISSPQDAEWTASDDGQGPYSSVQPFQFAHYESEEAAVNVDPPETVGNSLPSQEEEDEEEDEEEEEDDCRQPSGINIIDMAYRNLSIECVDNADGLPGVIVYDDKTFPISSQQETAFGAGQGSCSSVRSLQFSEVEDEDNAMDCDPLETDSVSKARYDDDDDEVPMQVDPQV